MGFRGASVKSAAGRLGMANAQLDRAQRNYNRVMQVFNENPGALSLADRDAAETSLAAAQEQVSSAEADLEKAKQSLGAYGAENAELREAIANLEQAQLNLAYTTIYAPSNGFIESYNLDVGYYCSAGSPMATFISTSDVWIQADFRENSLENIHQGEDVEFILDIAPGRKFKGKVRSIGYAVSSSQDVNRGGLPTVQGRSGWLRDPQRFPVIIALDHETVKEYFKIGGQVDVVVYSDRYGWLNTIAKFRLWLNSRLSYVR
jgi:multidrug resistance efflux pump